MQLNSKYIKRFLAIEKAFKQHRTAILTLKDVYTKQNQVIRELRARVEQLEGGDKHGG